MASRRRAWLRDELILALDLYMREGPNVPVQQVRELSDVLRAFPIEPELASDPRFRSPNSVGQKLGNFRTLDPNVPGGLDHGGAGDAEVWEEFYPDPGHLSAAAAAIRANLTALPEDEDEREEEFDGADAEEGRLLTRLHIRRERSRRLVALKKEQAVQAEGRLACECCGFDFAEAYGERGEGFIECHHLRPVAELRPGQRTRLADLALVCSNCHRMIHRRQPWLTLEEVRVLIQAATVPGSPPQTVSA